MTLPREYVTALSTSTSLLAAVQDARRDDFEEEFQLVLKLRLARQAFADRMQAWSEIREKILNDPKREKEGTTSSALAANAVMLNAAILEYLEIAEKIVKVDERLSQYVSVHTVQGVVQQMRRVLTRELRNVIDPQVMKRIESCLDAEVKIERDTTGNDILPPEMAVNMMDDSVPSVAETLDAQSAQE